MNTLCVASSFGVNTQDQAVEKKFSRFKNHWAVFISGFLVLLVQTATAQGQPEITSPSIASATVGQSFTYAITTPTSFAATGLPPGLTLNTNTGGISGIPTTTGTYTVALSASNASGTGTKTLTLTIKSLDSIPPKVVITTPTANTRTTSSPLTITGTATDNLSVAAVEYRIETTSGTNAYAAAAGTTAWSTAVPIAPGASTIRVRARDASGNLSPEVTRVFYYDIAKPISVTVIGSGIVTPNLNTSNLVVGKTYSMTATVQKGTTFDGWTGYGTTPNKSATLSFVMSENLSLTAKFVDLAKPTVVIATPVANTRTTTLPLTISGTATDNLSVSAVEYRIENASGTNAYTAAAGTTAWTIAVPLAPGASTIRVQARDASGNLSPEVSRVFYYDIAKPLAVTVIGSGLVTPNLNTSNLVVGKTYSMTATVQKGTTFDGWTGYGATPNKSATLSFVMSENLSLTAKFVDLAKPSVVITTPAANTRTTSLPLTITGTATDNLSVSAVEYRIENASGTNAYATAAGTTAWSIAVPLTPGASTIRVRARDASGNLSSDVTRVFYFDVVQPLDLWVTGSGTVAPNLNSSNLVVGRTYSMTATPAAGFRFDGWSELECMWDICIGTNKNVLTFAMPNRPVYLEARFVDSAPPTVVITTPVNNAIITTLGVLVKGTASDNQSVSKVFVRVDQGEWVEADGTTSWAFWLDVVGNQTLSVYAVDSSGNESAVKTMTIRVPSVPDYSGIYFGTLSGDYGERGLVGVLVTKDQKAVVLIGDDTSEQEFGGFLLKPLPLGTDGKTSLTIAGVKIAGAFTSSGFTITIDADGDGVRMSGSKKAATGNHATLAGLYMGSYEHSQDEGAFFGLVAADGKTQVFFQSTEGYSWGDISGGAVLGSIDNQRQFRVTFNQATLTGTVKSKASVDPRTLSFPSTIPYSSLFNDYIFGTQEWLIPGESIILGSEFWLVGGIAKPSQNYAGSLLSQVFDLISGWGMAPVYEPFSGTTAAALMDFAELENSLTTLQSASVQNMAPTEGRILRIEARDAGFGFVFSTQIGRTYRVQSSSDLVNWIDVTSAILGTEAEYEFSDSRTEEIQRFYRVVTE